jgi:hypothetical protein
MLAASAPFPHLDAVQAILDRAAGLPADPSTESVGRTLFPAPFVTAGTLLWPWEHAHRVLYEWARWTREMPHDVTSVARLVRIPPLFGAPVELRGRSFVAIEVAIPREPWIAAGRLAALRRLEPEIDTIGTHAPDAIHPLHTGAQVTPPAVSDHMGLEAVPDAAIDAFLAIAGPASGSNLVFAALRHFGPAYGMCAAGLPVDGEDASRLDIRLGLLRGRLAPFAAGRPPVEDVVRAVQRATALIRRGEG